MTRPPGIGDTSSRRRRPRRHVVVVLGADDWDLLVASASRDERDPYQQARYLLVARLREGHASERDAADLEPSEVA